MEKSTQLERLFWSIALPGLGQLLNKKYIKGFIFIFLEILINVNSNLNQAIIFSYYGEFEQAILITDYHWLMFYPCVYLFAIYDAYKDAGGASLPFSFVPFVLSAYFGTLGVIYSRSILGPVLLPILLLFLGGILGILIRKLFMVKKKQTR